jgi:hypothetical protein
MLNLYPEGLLATQAIARQSTMARTALLAILKYTATAGHYFGGGSKTTLRKTL